MSITKFLDDSKLDVSQRVFVQQQSFTPLNEAYEERIHLRLCLSYLDMNYVDDGAKTADDVSQNFLSLTTHKNSVS